MLTNSSAAGTGMAAATVLVALMLALCLSVLLTVAGAPVLIGLAAIAVLVLFVQFAAVFPVPALGASILGLGLGPFLWGYTSGVAPKVFIDEVLLLLYLIAIPLLYTLTPARRWHGRFGAVYGVLFALIAAHCVSFALGTDLVALRNFIETYALGALLLVLFLQEGCNIQPEKLVPYILLLTVLLSAFQVVEKAFEWNPLWKNVDEFLYLSPEVARATEGTYRPYATFFSPSEAGTFVAMGLPFSLWIVRYRKSKAAWAAVAIIFAGLAVNGTRGVWLAVALLIFGTIPNAIAIAAAAIPVLGLAAWAGYLAFQSSAFVQRLADPNNLLIRFHYWRVAEEILKSHWLTGVGHLQFRKVYLEYVRNMNSAIDWDVRKIFVADNLYLTTLVEHGVLGLGALLAALYLCLRTLRRGRLALGASGSRRMADFVRCIEFAVGVYAISGFLADVELFTKVTKYVLLLIGLGLAVSYSYVHSERIADTN
jgi:hypothetical protein